MSLLAFVLAASVQAPVAPADRAVLDCAYESPESGEMLTVEHCAWKDAQGRVHLTRDHLSRLTYDRYGLAGVYVEGWRYLTRDGRSAAVLAFDNGPDPFAEGLARSPVGEKIGYIDRTLRTVIPAEFDGAFPFEHGVAVVCVGCRAQSEGEHAFYAGGSWGCIDHRGHFVTAWRAAPGYTPCPPPNRPRR
jgi:hypothetical protein